MKPAPPVTTNTSVTRGLYHPPSTGKAARGARGRRRMLGRGRRSAPPRRRASRKTSVCERCGAESGAGPPVLVARRREDVEHDAAHAERAPAVRHVGWRLPEVAGLHVVLDAVLDTDPLALETDAPLLVGVR